MFSSLRTLFLFLVCTFPALALFAGRDAQVHTVFPEHLLCDGSADPLGVDHANPEFRWLLRAADARARGLRQSAYRILVADSATALAQGRGDVWDSGKVAGGLSPATPYAGKPLAADHLYFWTLRVWDEDGRPSPWSAPAHFLTGLKEDGWQARWIAASPDGPKRTQASGDDDARVGSVDPLPIFRRGFAVEHRLVRATLFISGLGESAAFINGKPVTNARLTPGWSDYRKTVLYDTYDVTALLRPGTNALGVMLGNGMYNVQGLKGRYTKFVGSFGQPKLIAELHLHYAEGTEATIGSDDDWRTAPGPVVFDSIYGGEDYDARREVAGWLLPAFDDHTWKRATLVDGPGGTLQSERLPAVEVTHRYAPVKVTRVAPGDTVYDLGQNFAGVPEISVSGPAGSAVRILPGELLDATGHVTQASAYAFPDAPVLFNYTLSGHGVEQWTPRFTYYGFRYLEVKTSGGAAVHSVQGDAIHDAATTDGHFSSSNDLLNRIHRLIDIAIENNMVSVLTDCPTREKLGWLEQTHLAGAGILYNYGLSQLYWQMAQDMRDSQLPSGLEPSIAPEVVAFSGAFRDSPEWGSAIILSPWVAYTFYGDPAPLRDNYDAMVKYANYLGGRAKDDMLAYGLGDWYDIGPGAPGESKLTGLGLTATAIYYQDLSTLAKAAALLGKSADADAFAARAEAVKDSLNAHLFHPDTNSYDRGSQTANAMPLALGLVPEGHRQAVLDNLVADISAHGNHVTAGDVGFHYVVRALTGGGRSDVLYDMVTRTDSPSYGYQLAHGATALTEAWDANPASSQDHFMLGHAEEWFYRGLAGIDIDMSRPGDDRIWIHPQVPPGLHAAEASYDSVLGRVSSRWTEAGGRFQLDITVPAGAAATVTLPAGFHSAVHGGDAPFVVGSGRYHFTASR